METDINKEERKCDICKLTAVYICYDCLYYLCDSCDKFIHEKSENILHQKDKIDSFISIDIKCPYHPINSINLFCSTEKSKLYLLYYK